MGCMKVLFSRRLWCVTTVAFLASCASAPAPQRSSAAGAATNSSKAVPPMPKQGTPPQPIDPGKPADTSVQAAPNSPTTSVPQAAEVPSSIDMGDSAERGLASWYGPGFQGKRTASGERFNAQAMTAAHKTLPFGTQVRVKSLSTGKQVVVRINDRGPFIKGRIIDLSSAAARALGISGLHQVEIARLR